MDDSDDDNYYYGTPLEELDEDNVRQAKAPRIEDQVVLDKQGRRRFHGAFTGGFSAGFFNSVGTKEGWAPSTFVSSRSQRADGKLSKPQDFMDDEDLAAHGIHPQGIQATTSYDDSERRKRKRVVDPDGPIPGLPVLEEILKPNKETVGMKLLRKLGWKPGQGIGPRVKLHQKKISKTDSKKIYGCQLPTDINDVSDEDADVEGLDPEVTFAPDDVEAAYLSTPKVDQFGLGYKPLDRTPVLGGHINLFDPSPLSMTEKKKKVLIKGQAFGVGAFEEDDEDIYATEDMSNYDFGEGDKKATSKNSQQPQSHMGLMGLIEMIDGFSLSNQRYEPKVYPKPVLSKDFTPQHKSRRRRFELKDSEKQGLGRHELTSEQRARIIGDQPHTTVEVRSGVKTQTIDPPSGSRELDTFEVDKIFEEFENIEGKSRPDFKPFGKDPEKQRRYDLYLKMKDNGQKDRYYLVQPKKMTEWEKERESREFDRASKLFQPLTSTMATRFVSAVTEDNKTGLKDGLNMDVPKCSEESSSSEVDALGHDVADDRVKAARMNMFGKLTQTVLDWYPDRLLCRRFNVPDPFPDSSFVGVRRSKREKFSIFSFFEEPRKSTMTRREKSTSELATSVEVADMSQTKEESNEAEGESSQTPETYGLKVPVDGPPTMDLFKAIFQDSDSEDDSEESSKRKSNDSDKIEASKSNEFTNQASRKSSNRKSSESESEDERSNLETKRSLDSFLSNMRKGTENTNSTEKEPAFPIKEPLSTDGTQRKRISRFEPQKDDTDDISEIMPKPVFRPRKKSPPKSLEPVPAKGIFANIDFEELNSYRHLNPSEETEKSEEQNTLMKEKEGNYLKGSSDSSVESEDEYGPAVPSHLQNRQQMIRSFPPVNMPVVDQQKNSDRDDLWIIKEKKGKCHKKHKHDEKHKKKKEKKKKKHKERKHKRKSKKHKRKSDSSSSSDSSDD